MGTEALYIPEDDLPDVLLVIKLGLSLAADNMDPYVFENLTNWVAQEEAYLQRLRDNV